MDRWNRLGCAAFLLTASLAEPALGAKDCLEFEELALTLEQNATDGDTEVVLFAKGGDEGLRRLTITAPDGRKLATLEVAEALVSRGPP